MIEWKVTTEGGTVAGSSVPKTKQDRHYATKKNLDALGPQCFASGNQKQGINRFGAGNTRPRKRVCPGPARGAPALPQSTRKGSARESPACATGSLATDPKPHRKAEHKMCFIPQQLEALGSQPR